MDREAACPPPPHTAQYIVHYMYIVLYTKQYTEYTQYSILTYTFFRNLYNTYTSKHNIVNHLDSNMLIQ